MLKRVDSLHLYEYIWGFLWRAQKNWEGFSVFPCLKSASFCVWWFSWCVSWSNFATFSPLPLFSISPVIHSLPVSSFSPLSPFSTYHIPAWSSGERIWYFLQDWLRHHQRISRRSNHMCSSMCCIRGEREKNIRYRRAKTGPSSLISCKGFCQSEVLNLNQNTSYCMSEEEEEQEKEKPTCYSTLEECRDFHNLLIPSFTPRVIASFPASPAKRILLYIQ